MKENRQYPDSKRRPKNHVCKNCEFITVKINLPCIYDDEGEKKKPKVVMRETAKATKVTGEFKFYCTFAPLWHEVQNENKHHCGQFLLRPNWQQGYQDIERTWGTVDLVYETRWDCTMSPAA